MMKHLGDITKIDWFQVEPVDVVTGGSPCQDLSIAGKRKGLAGERSGLFMWQIRCVKELRQADVLRGRTGVAIRPRFMVWENVPGAFSSGKPKGADFAAVIEEIIKVCELGAAVHIVPPGDGWTKSGCYYADDGRWSIAWRLHDAQFWGVPQRRKRIALVADFGGLAAPEILFERKGLSGDFEPGEPQGEETAGGTGSSADSTSTLVLNDQGGSVMSVSEDVSGCLRAQEHGHQPIVAAIPINTMITTRSKALGERTGLGIGKAGDAQFTLSAAHCHAVCAAFSAGQGEKAGGIGWQEECAPSLKAVASGTNMVPAILPFDTTQITSPQNGNHPHYGDPCHPLAAGAHAPAIATNFVMAHGQANAEICEDLSPTLNCNHEQPIVIAVDCRNGTENPDVNGTLQAKSTGGSSLNLQNVARVGQAVRRLTPLECERLQGYPDGWTDIGDWTDSKGKRHKEADSPRYKALGNSIALPFWCWLAKRISAQYERDITMGSLFDRIGGFPYAFEKCNGKGAARWASEIEEFPIAVTKIRFGED